MKKLHMRSVALAFSLFVFICLLASGGYRLVGHDGAHEPICQRETADAACGALCAPPAQSSEVSFAAQQEKAPHKAVCSVYQRREIPCAAVCSDANGNVLGDLPYLRAVYQLFSLGDGFV